MQEKIALIMGNGPSLTELDFDTISNNPNVITYATNRVSLVFDETTWRPNYYTCFTSLSGENSEWQDSIKKVVDNKETKCFLLTTCKGWLGEQENVTYVNPYEHHRHSEIPSNIFEINVSDKFLKSYSATTSLIQLALSHGHKHLCLIGQDGYKKSKSNNHFSKKYGFDPGNFDNSNKRLISLHEVLKNHSKKHTILIENLSSSSILEMYEYSNRFIKEQK